MFSEFFIWRNFWPGILFSRFFSEIFPCRCDSRGFMITLLVLEILPSGFLVKVDREGEGGGGGGEITYSSSLMKLAGVVIVISKWPVGLYRKA